MLLQEGLSTHTSYSPTTLSSTSSYLYSLSSKCSNRCPGLQPRYRLPLAASSSLRSLKRTQQARQPLILRLS